MRTNFAFRLNAVKLFQFSSSQLPHQPVIIWYLSRCSLTFLRFLIWWMTPKSCNPSQKRAYIYAPEIIELSSAFSVFALTFNASCSKCRSKPHFLISQSVHICNAIDIQRYQINDVSLGLRACYKNAEHKQKKNSVWCGKKIPQDTHMNKKLLLITTSLYVPRRKIT